MKKYIAVVQEYLGCPRHGEKGEPSVRFFNTIEEYVDFIKENVYKYYVHGLLDNGKEVLSIEYIGFDQHFLTCVVLSNGTTLLVGDFK